MAKSLQFSCDSETIHQAVTHAPDREQMDRCVGIGFNFPAQLVDKGHNIALVHVVGVAPDGLRHFALISATVIAGLSST